VTILQARLRRVFALFHSLRLSQPDKDSNAFRVRRDADNEKLNAAVASLLEPDLDQLRMAPADAASALRTVTFSLTHPIIGDQRFTEPEQIVDLILHGISNPPSRERLSC